MDTLNTVMKVCNFFGIMPLQTTTQPVYTKLHKTYCGLILGYYVWSFYYFVYARLTNPEFGSYTIVITIVDLITYFILTVTIMTVTISTVFWRSQECNKLFEDLDTVGKELNVKKRSSKRDWTTFTLLQLLLFTVISADITVFSSALGFRLYNHYLRKQFIWYIVNVLVFVFYVLSNEAELKFKSLNERVLTIGRSIVGNFKRKWDISMGPRESNKILFKDFACLKKIYDLLCDVVDNYNLVFGLVFLIAVLNNIGHILFYTIALLEIRILPCQILSALWLLLNLSHTMLIASACDGLAKEAGRTTTVCYILLSEIPVAPRQYYQRLLKEEVYLLEKQSGSRRPLVSAAGFFTVNLMMMGFIVSSVTSYIIVAIQFMWK